jgi:hypothetical protein
MKTVKAFIEKSNDGTYSVYVDLKDNSLNYGIHGTGNTAQEAIDDFNKSYIEMKAFYAKKGKKFTEADFEFVYDVASFLSFYNKFLSLAGLERLTGVSQGQLSHYATGHRKPGNKTVEKIQTRLQAFGKELQHLEFA